MLIPAGESLDDHQVHERAWVTVLAGEVEITTTAGERINGGSGLLIEFSPNERHAVHARTDAHLLLLLTLARNPATQSDPKSTQKWTRSVASTTALATRCRFRRAARQRHRRHPRPPQQTPCRAG
jgi:hypothetical protein